MKWVVLVSSCGEEVERGDLAERKCGRTDRKWERTAITMGRIDSKWGVDRQKMRKDRQAMGMRTGAGDERQAVEDRKRGRIERKW
jgi:hypothetical protein